MTWFKNSVEQAFAKWVGSALGVGIIVSVMFYTSTNQTLAQQSQDILKLKDMVENSDNALNVWKINKLEVTSQEQKADIKELKHEFTEFQKQYAKDREEILKLLYEIKKK
jgi:molecular chaperone GrpE (heat shock protein)